MSEPLTYKDLWYGDITIEDNELFNKRHLADHKQFIVLLNTLGFTVIDTFKSGKSDIYGHSIKDQNGRKFNIIFQTLKHSGSKNNRMRAHISPHLVNNFNDNDIYLFSAYNSGDEIIYVIGEITDFVKKTSISRNNSSFWIGSIDNLIDIYKSGEKIWYRSKDKTLLKGIISSKINNYDNDTFITHFFTNTETNFKRSDLDSDDYFVEPERVDVKSLSKYTDETLPRNQKYKELAILNANFTCELCGKKDTFETFKGYEYFEGHHLIMYNVASQSRYDLSLDIPRNIVCLCPECHRKIHLSKDEDIKKYLIELLLKHQSVFKIYEFENIDDIFNDYIKNRKKGD